MFSHPMLRWHKHQQSINKHKTDSSQLVQLCCACQPASSSYMAFTLLRTHFGIKTEAPKLSSLKWREQCSLLPSSGLYLHLPRCSMPCAALDLLTLFQTNMSFFKDRVCFCQQIYQKSHSVVCGLRAESENVQTILALLLAIPKGPYDP